MAERTVTVGTSTGLHSRPAALFVAAVAKAGVPVTLAVGDGAPVNASSILSVISLGVKGGDEVTLAAEGAGAEDALGTLGDLLTADLDETES